VLALVAGFGLQAGLFARLRACRAGAAGGGASMAASTGTSTAAMLACCTHHLTELLPILGVSGLVIFLGTYKTPLLWLGLAMNLAGIGYLVWGLRAAWPLPRQRRSPKQFPLHDDLPRPSAPAHCCWRRTRHRCLQRIGSTTNARIAGRPRNSVAPDRRGTDTAL
jgi:hypothetical protein